MPIARVPVDTSTLCETALHDARAMHPHCQYQVSTKGRRDAELDPIKMHQLLVNLLGNAGQHGADGHPILLEADGTDSEVGFSVSNKGERLSQEALQMIFQPMVRIASEDQSSALSKTSLGLGLHIAREIASAHSGTITVTSTDACTTFAVCLPRHA